MVGAVSTLNLPDMELGNLFNKTKENQTPPETFIAIQIQEGLIKTAVWQVDNAQAKITSYGSVEKWSDVDSLVVAADTSLSVALEGKSDEPDRVIFGLPDSWVKEDKISLEAAPHLKELIQKLELKPIGFVVLTEAVIQQLKAQEGIPPSAVFLELHSTKVNVVVTASGETVGKEEVGRGGDLAKDVEEALTRMNLDTLPARIIIIDGQEPDIEQQLTSYSWDNLPFLHLPKVELPDQEFSVKAVAISGGSQAARSLGIEVEEEETEITESPEAKTEGDTALEPEDIPATETTDLDGFVVGQDIRNLNEEPTEQYVEDPVEKTPTPSQKFNPQGILSKLSSFSNPFSSFSPGGKLKKIALIGIPVSLLLLFFGSIFAFSRISTASITVIVEDKTIDKSVQIAIADNPSDSLPTLPATSESIKLDAEGQVPTTGEALVGEKSTGEVNIFNKTDSEKQLDQGTIIITSENLKFTLDESITIASSSSQVKEDGSGEETIYGQAKVKVTASSIGAESNLDSDTEFSVGSFPKTSLVAKSTTSFSGGTSRTVKAVAKKDQEELLNKLKADLDARAQGELNTDPEFQVVFERLELLEENFSHKVGEEADALSLNLSANVHYLKFHQDRLGDLVKDQLSSDIPAGFVLGAEDTQITIDPPENSGDQVTTTAHIKTNLLPDVAESEFKAKLAGKSVEKAKGLIRSIPGYQDAIVEISPHFPLLSSRYPGNQDNIDIQFKIAN